MNTIQDLLWPLFIGVFLGGTAIPCLAVLGIRFLKKSSASTRHRFWTATAVGLLVFPLGVLTADDRFVKTGIPTETTSVVGQVSPSIQDSFEPFSTPQDFDSASFPRNAEAAARKQREFSTSESAFAPIPAVKTKPKPLDFNTAAAASKTAVVLVWLMGIGGWFVAYLTTHGRMMLFRLRRRASGTMPAEMSALGEAMRRWFRIRRSVRFELDAKIPVPLAMGVFRPIVLFPLEAQAWPGGKIRSVLLHELAHIARADLFWQNLVQLARIVYWFHPLVWFVARQVRVEQELACDDMVLESGERGCDYADVLLDLAKHLSLQETIPAGGLAMIRKKTVTKRIESILDPTTSRRPISRAKSLVILLVALFFTFGISLFAPHVPLRLFAQAEAPAKAENGTNRPQAMSANIGVPFTFTGKVAYKENKEAKEKAIAGATVLAQLWDGPDFVNGGGPSPAEKCRWEHQFQTDAQGKYSFDVPQELKGKQNLHIKIMAEHPDYISRGFHADSIGSAMASQRLSNNEDSRGKFGDFSLDTAVKVTGAVQSPEGKPLPKILVRAVSRSPHFENVDAFFAVTDAQGKFTVKAYPETALIVSVIPQDYAPLVKQFEKPLSDLGLLKLEDGVVVQGRLVDRNAKPVAGEWVNITEKNSPAPFPQHKIWRSCRTDENGAFTMKPLSRGEYSIAPREYPMDPLTVLEGMRPAVMGSEGIVTLEDRKRRVKPDLSANKSLSYVYQERNVTVGETSPLLVELKPAPSVPIHARFSDSAGKPYAEPMLVVITGKFEGKVWQAIKDPIRADEHGGLTLDVPQGLEHVILVCGPTKSDRSRPIRFRREQNAAPQTDWCVEFEKIDQPIADLEITILKPGILRVAILDGQGLPFSQPSPFTRREYKNQRLFKDDDHGGFGFHQGFGDLLKMEQTAEPVPRVPQVVNLLTWETYPVLPGDELIVSAAERRLEHDGGKNVVKEGKRTAQTVTLREGEDRSVRLTLERLPEAANPATSGNNSPGEAEEPPASKEEKPIVVGEERTITIRGRVLLPDGSPAKNLLLRMQQLRSQGEISDFAQTDEDGYYTTELHVDAYFTAQITRGLLASSSPTDGLASPEVATIVTDPPKPGQFDIQLQKGIKVHGKLTHENGMPAAGLDIWFCDYPFGQEPIVAQDGTSNGSRHVSLSFRATSDKHGEYSLALVPGEYVVTQDIKLGEKYNEKHKKTITLRPGDKELNIDVAMLPNPTPGRVTLPDGSPGANLHFYYAMQSHDGHGTYGVDAHTDAEGKFAILLSPLSNCIQVAAKDDKFGIVRAVQGDERIESLELVLQPPATGKVRLVSETTGKPIAGLPLTYSPIYPFSKYNGAVYHKGNKMVEEVVSDSDGRIALPKLFLGGEYELCSFKTTGNNITSVLRYAFVPKKSGEVIDLGEKRVQGDFSRYEPRPQAATWAKPGGHAANGAAISKKVAFAHRSQR